MGGCKAEPSSIRYKIVFLRRTYYRVVALGSRRAPPYARSVTHELPRISNRVGSIAESATLKVDGKAKALQAAGRPVISYAAGEPDFATPEHIVEAALAAVRDPKNYRYTPAVGLPELARKNAGGYTSGQQRRVFSATGGGWTATAPRTDRKSVV